MWVFVAALLLGLAAGFLLCTFMPDVLFDEAFRRDFFTSAGFAGLAALIAAIVAYAAARHTAASAREHALETEVAPDAAVASAGDVGTEASTPTGTAGTMGSGGNHD